MKAYVSEIKKNEGLITIDNHEVEINDYTDYYKPLDCKTFDVAMIEYKGAALSLYIDDEGLLVPGNIGREIHGYPQPLFGNIVICGGVDNIGNTLSVPDWFGLEDVAAIIGPAKYIIGD